MRPVTVWYMAHPVGGDLPGNVARAKRWLRWFAGAWPNVVVIAPYLVEIEIGLQRDHVPEEREIGLRRCEATARICDAVVLVGGRVSTGMSREAGAAKLVIDLTWLGAEPPEVT